MNRSELFWRNLSLALRRAARDKRALSNVLGVFALLSYAAYLLWTVTYLGPWGTVCLIVVMGLAIGGATFINKKNARDGESILSLSSPSTLQINELREHRIRLANILLCKAIVVDRANNENLHRMGKIDSRREGICRRRTLDLAHRPELWQTLSIEERDLLMSPEGTWKWDAVWPRIIRIEDVRVLRWILKIDPILTPFEFLKPDLTAALEITTRPEQVEGKGCMPPWDLRPAQHAAEQMLTRCIAEGIHRGFLTIEDKEARAQYIHLARTLGASQSEDLLIGSTIVAESDRQHIEWVAQAALRRTNMLAAVIKYLNSSPEEKLEFA
jgi:hypothetical protein